MFRRSTLLGLGLVSLVMAGCALHHEGQTYHASNNGRGLGYSETRVGHNEWKVNFTGHNIPIRQTEDFALLRAAHVVKAAGYSYFTIEHENSFFVTRGMALGAHQGGTRAAVVNHQYPETDLVVRAQSSRTGHGHGKEVYTASSIISQLNHKYNLH